MATMTVEDILREFKDYGTKAATALSAAAEDYCKYVEDLGGQAASAEQKAEAMVQALGYRIQNLARDFQLSSELADISPVAVELRQKAAAAFAEQARALTADTASAQAKAAQFAADAQKGLRILENAKGLLGSAAMAAGPIVDAAMMAEGLWEWTQTGSSDKFGQACMGVIGGTLGGIMGASLGVLLGPAAAAAGAGIGAVIGSSLGEIFYGALNKWVDWAMGPEGWMLGMGEWGDGGLNGIIADNFNAAQAWVRRVDPLILDLDGDGIETVGVNANTPLLFDHNGDGVKTSSGWIKPDDGFLVLDRNGNGIIDNGTELFGDSTPLAGGSKAMDGFAALAQEDTNGDGQVDASDSRFANLRVWRDLNSDGVSQSGELLTLATLGITAINVAKTNAATTLVNGNIITGLGNYTKSDGSTATMGTSTMGDVDLTENTFVSQFTEAVTVTPEAAALPDLNGAGQVRSLREAASLSSNLLTILDGYAAAATRDEQRASLDDLLKAWSDTSTMSTTATGAYAGHSLTITFQGITTGSAAYQDWLDKLTILERFNGETFREVPTGSDPVVLNFQTPQMDLLEQSYQVLKESLYQGTVVQTARLSALLDNLTLTLNRTGFCFDPADVITELSSRIAANSRDGLADLIDFYQATKDQVPYQGDGMTEYLLATLSDQSDLTTVHDVLTANGIVVGGTEITTLTAPVSGGILIGKNAAETLQGNVGADTLTGGAGNDTLYGGAGDDILIGGLGNDTLYGGNGDDTFRFNLGDGQDVIVNDEVAGVNTLAFGTGITLADLRLVRNGDNLVLQVGDQDDQVTLQGWYATDSYYRTNWTGSRLDSITFADGTSMAAAALLLQKPVNGTDGNDILNGYNGSNDGRFGISLAENDWFSSGQGDDTLFGDTGNDTLDGGSGVDILKGGEGNDILIGGLGNDTLYGGNGDDTFRFNLGDGQDVIVNDDVAGVNTLAFGEGISVVSLKLVRNGDDLVLKVGDQGDQVTLQGWYATDSYYRTNWTGSRLDSITFADGTSMTAAALLLQKPVNGTDGNDILNGYNGSNDGRFGISLAENDWFSGGLGDDTLFGDTGNDILDGGAGTDILKGGEGDDILIGGLGNDTLYGGNGDDTFRFNLGDGQDVIVNDEVAGVNTLAFGTGITLADLRLVRNGDNLVLQVGDQDDQVTLQGWYATDSYYRTNWTGSRLDSITFADGTSMAAAALLLQKPVNGTDGNDILNGYNGSNDGRFGISLAENDWFSSGQGDDTLFGDTGNDTLDGGSGVDILKGGEGNDILIGGLGNDTLYGGNGDDTFRFNLGDGQDVIVNDDVAGVNTLAFGEGISVVSLKLVRNGDDLVFKVGDQGDQVTLQGWYATDSYYRTNWTGSRLDSITFADGTSMTAAALLLQKPVNGTDGNDILNGYNGSNDGRFGISLAENDWFSGGLGDDTLFGDTGNDILDGGAGTDILKGGEGDDILIGGLGNDTLYGGNGDDTFRFNLGDGQDVIVNDEVAGVNTLAFGTGITLADLRLVRNGDNLVLQVGDQDDQVTLQGWYATDSYYRTNWTGSRLDSITFADGTSMAAAALLLQKPVNGTDGNDILNGYNGSNDGRFGISLAENDWFSSGQGDDTLFGDTGNDTLDGGSGVDILKGGEGNDILIGGLGNDTLYGGNGDDTFRFNLGDGQDVIVNDDVAGVNTLAFGEGISVVSLKLVRNGDDLVLKVGDQGDQVTLQGWYATDSYYRTNWTGSRLDSITFADGTSMTAAALLLQKPVNGTDGNDILNGYNGSNDGRFGISLAENDWFSGGLGDDTLFGDTGNDILDGGAGTDILKGGEGDDILIGGLGNDTLYGGNGDDTFRFNLGDGQDVIVNDEVAGVNTLAFGTGITLADLRLVRNGDNLVLQVGDQDDQVTLQGWYATDSYYRTNWTGSRLDSITFADGTSMAAAALLLQKPVNGTDGNDILNGYNGSNDGRFGISLAENDWFSGGLGDDTLFGDTGNDTLDGGAGTDILKGGEGNDILIGGLGNDTLYGGNGDDTFRFNLGDGQDVIVNDDVAGVNTLAFGSGITLADLRLVRNGDDLVLQVGDQGDQVTLQGWYATDSYYRTNWTGSRLDSITFADGTSMTAAALLLQKPVNGTDGNDILNGYNGSNDGRFGISLAENDWFSGGQGDDTLFGDTGNDTLDGGAGTDILKGGEGNDILIGGLGNDTLYGGNGNDMFVFDTALSAPINQDIIMDFIAGQDKIQLDKDVFPALSDEGTLTSDYFHSSSNGMAVDSNDYILYNATSGTLLYDADGNGSGAAVQFATLTTKPAITASDCMVVA